MSDIDDIQDEIDIETRRQRRATDHSLWVRVNYWLAKRAIVVFLISIMTGTAAFMGYTPGTSPGGRFVRMEQKIEDEADTTKALVKGVADRVQKLEDNHHELRNYVHFLVVKTCLELDAQTRRDLQVRGISCTQFLSGER